MPFPFIIAAVAAKASYAAIAGYMAAGAGTTVGGYFVVPYVYNETRGFVALRERYSEKRGRVMLLSLTLMI